MIRTLKIAVCLVGVSLGLSAQKPILPDFHADPSFHQWDGKYWLYPSKDEPGSTTWKQMKRWECFSSTNLTDWKNEGEIFGLDKIKWADEAAFAPDAMKWKGKYYFFFPAGFKIGVAVSDKPNGPFVDALGKPLIENREVKAVNTFDPCIFIDDDQRPYLYYGGGNGCAIMPLKANLIERAADPVQLPLKGYAEGIWVFKRKGVYYFTYPSHREKNGKITQLLVYSTAPTPYGPFTYRGSFLDNKSRNSHHSIAKVGDQWYLFYHIQGPSAYERRVCAEYLYFDKEGLIKPIEMTKEGIKPFPIAKLDSAK